MLLSTPRLVVAGLAGDSGKTLVSLGLARAWSAQGLSVAPFKKGPDYIDAAWLGCAAGAPGRNLDTFMMSPEAIGDAIARGLPADVVLIEGNRGLFDGLDAEGTQSTAELARLLGAPVVLVVDVTKMTRTTAALVLGCTAFDPGLNLAGVVLNRVGTQRQEATIREAIRRAGGPPVLGAIRRLRDDPLPGRHLGLVTAAEHPRRDAAVEVAATAVSGDADLRSLLEIAESAGDSVLPDPEPVVRASSDPLTIGVFRDESSSFYYPENLEALEAAGAKLVFVSPLRDRDLPAIDGLYFGGGFPEVHASRLAENRSLHRAVRAAADRRMPVYAECGGLMLLARELVVDGVSHPMSGVLDLVVEQRHRPQGHGYVEATVDRPNPWFAGGTRLRGHEFHYSTPIGGADLKTSTLRLERGHGVGVARDGLAKDRVWASYLHLHALGTPSWARSFVELAGAYRREQRTTGRFGDSGTDEESGHGPEDGDQRVVAFGS